MNFKVVSPPQRKYLIWSPFSVFSAYGPRTASTVNLALECPQLVPCVFPQRLHRFEILLQQCSLPCFPLFYTCRHRRHLFYIFHWTPCTTFNVLSPKKKKERGELRHEEWTCLSRLGQRREDGHRAGGRAHVIGWIDGQNTLGDVADAELPRWTNGSGHKPAGTGAVAEAALAG